MGLGGELDHPAGAAGRTEAAPFAREGDEVFVATCVTLDPKEPVLEPAAPQVVIELLFDERGQRASFSFEPGEKLRVVSLDDAVKRVSSGRCRS